MRTEIIFVPTLPHFITILVGGEKLRLFHMAGALSSILNDSIADSVEHIESTCKIEFVKNLLDDFLSMYSEDLGVTDFYTPESLGFEMPEDVCNHILVLRLNTAFEDSQIIIPSIKHYLLRGWRGG